ncbi:ABC-type multidrug transport system, permease component [hydrothermal vent metagenome]|uniref:ABC-type multidrug transport system, permease component n=1 Tax=hydrothermal vent metagenome TaxID=652676 RepID=A0A3B0YXW0_9ZZZZ
MVVDTWHLFNKYLIISLRTPLWSLFNLIQPLIWLVIFGQLFRNMAQLPGFPEGSYMDFFVPGVLIMTVLFGSSWSGVSLLREITAGSVDKMLVAPISRVSIVLSRVLHSAVQVMIQASIILIAAALIGTNINPSFFPLLGGLVIILLLGIGFAALSNGFAIMIQREEPLVVIGNLMTLPLMFFSTAMVPKSFMPDWIAFISQVNPINYAVEAVRGTMVGELNATDFFIGLGVVGTFAAVSLIWAVSVFNGLRD